MITTNQLCLYTVYCNITITITKSKSQSQNDKYQYVRIPTPHTGSPTITWPINPFALASQKL